MWLFLLFLGFIQLYAYDINSITKKYKLITHLFFLGFSFISIATIGFIIQNFDSIPCNAMTYIACGGLLLSLVFLLYTLFFALPFDDTYRSDTNQICNQGMYALCRHPGVIWFFFLYLSLACIFQTKEAWLFGLTAHILNVFYVILQDRIIFPVSFPGYDAYQKTTPFLIPNCQSIRMCIATMRR